MKTKLIALSQDVYDDMLTVKHYMEKRARHPLSFSKVEQYLIQYWNHKIKQEDLHELENKT